MRKKIEKEYYLGLDIGTDSVGWAVTDLNYKLLRVNSKNLWGVRLFETAETAANRRAFRTARRRLSRRKFRIELLQQLFAPAINAVDPNFFARLSDSNLYEEDKRENARFSLFNDANFTDRDFHKKYQTVYHLRYAMMHEDNPDVRLVYLALHHIVKYRGHFLIEGGMDAVNDLSQPFTAINAYLQETDFGQLPMKQEEFAELAATLKCNKTDRARKYAELFGVTGDKRLCALLKLVAGCSVKVKDLPCREQSEASESITFDTDWDVKEAEARQLLQDDYVLVENAKLLYDYVQLKQLLQNYSCISEAMVAKYEKHKSDLAALKKVIRTYCNDKYDAVFKQPQNGDCNYTVYSGKSNFGKKGVKFDYKKKCSNEDFCKFIKKILSPFADKNDETLNAILADIDDGVFMPKQVSKNNSTLPYQLNEKELLAILDHVRQYPEFAFLNQVEDGTTVYEKIHALLTFRVPYFVGPTNNHSGKYWAVRREDGKLLPWNFERKIDYDASERNFIEQLTNSCPYVEGEKVLPKCSLLYEEFVFLNIVSRVKINDEPLTVQQKKELSEYFALSGESKLTAKTLRKWLKETNRIEADEEVLLTGFDDGASAHRRTYYQFVKILGREEVEKHYSEIENIIFDCTIAGTEKNRLRQRLTKNYPFLSEAQVKSIAGLTCKGWATCSAAFLLSRVGTNPFTGEINSFSIMDAMRETTENFMQVYNKYGFQQYFEGKRAQSRPLNEVIDALYCSPAVKKQIRQAMDIVAELRGILGHDPKKIFVEVARQRDPAEQRKQERERAKSRLQTLREKLEAESRLAVAEQAEDKSDLRKRLDTISENPRLLNKTKLFLYFLQNGLDIYTGEPIDYNRLESYDKDHIYPRSKVKDDSLDNLVLTLRTRNAEKTDIFPIAKEIQSKMRPVWETLHKQKLMSDEKFRRLTRVKPLSDEEINGFINRQLVETQQSTKEVIKLLKAQFPDSEVVFSKASLVSEFRAKQINVPNPDEGGDPTIRVPQFVKCREINDLHHAKDAYLNIVVGNVYNTRYGHNKGYMAGGVDRGPSDANIYDYEVSTASYTAWEPGANGTIAQVSKTMRSNAVLYSAESRVKIDKLFDATIYPKSDAALVPLKGENSSNEKYRRMSDTSKYGGYNSESRVYYTLVRFTEEKIRKKAVETKVKYCLLGVTAKFAKVSDTIEALTEYCRNCGLKDPVVLIPKIKVGTFFQFKSTILALSGMTGNRITWRPAQQNAQDDDAVRYFKKVCDVVEKQSKAATLEEKFVLDVRDGVDERRNELTYDLFVDTLLSSKYSGSSSLVSFGEKINSQQLRDKFKALSVAEQCRVLTEIAKVLQCNSQTANLTLLQEGAQCGKILTSNTFDTLDNISIVHRSVTGVFEQKIPLADFDKAENK